MNSIFVGETADLNQLPVDIPQKDMTNTDTSKLRFFSSILLENPKSIPTMVSNFVTISKHCHSSQITIETYFQIYPLTPPLVLLLLIEEESLS